MLSKEEVQKIIDDLQALKKLKGGGKAAAASDKAGKIESRVIILINCKP